MELVCPAGNLASLKVAVDAGANAVYLGPVEDYGEEKSGPGVARMHFVCWSSTGSTNPISMS